MIGPKLMQPAVTGAGREGAARRALALAGILPLLALTACAGSQRLGAGGRPPPGPAPGYGYGAPVYSEPVAPAPPVASAPITAEPLPPPGGSYPAASAPPAPAAGGLPPPADPFYQPNPPPAPANPAQGQQPPTLGGSGQVATLGQGSGSRRGGVSSRDGVVGGWTAKEATGTSCRVQLSSSPSLDVYRASASGCSNRDLQAVNAWDYRDGEVYLYQQGGAVVARLRASDGGAMSGAITKSGAALSMSR